MRHSLCDGLPPLVFRHGWVEVWVLALLSLHVIGHFCVSAFWFTDDPHCLVSPPSSPPLHPILPIVIHKISFQTINLISIDYYKENKKLGVGVVALFPNSFVGQEGGRGSGPIDTRKPLFLVFRKIFENIFIALTEHFNNVKILRTQSFYFVFIFLAVFAFNVDHSLLFRRIFIDLPTFYIINS